VIKPKVFVVGSVLALAVAYLTVTGLQTTTVYYFTVGELLARGPSQQPVRLAGIVTPGTVALAEDGLTLRFAVQDSTGNVAVVFTGGAPPDIFGEHVEVVAEGTFAPDGTFHASTLLAKCPSKFEGAVAQG
jgi:cytochrome c-type biogenesis protein CcmE